MVLYMEISHKTAVTLNMANLHMSVSLSNHRPDW
jgi:hypothetical protein